jgi:hypothetical protein
MASLALQLLEDLVVTFLNEQLARWSPLTAKKSANLIFLASF